MRVQRWRDIVITTDRRAYGSAAVLFAVAIGWMSWDYIAAEWYARASEREIIALANSIADNATAKRVAESFADGNYRHLTLLPHDADGQWWFHTPHRIGGSDWILMIGFDGDHVVTVRVGTSDASRRPDGAPPDRPVK